MRLGLRVRAKRLQTAGNILPARLDHVSSLGIRGSRVSQSHFKRATSYFSVLNG